IDNLIAPHLALSVPKFMHGEINKILRNSDCYSQKVKKNFENNIIKYSDIDCDTDKQIEGNTGSTKRIYGDWDNGINFLRDQQPALTNNILNTVYGRVEYI